MLDSARPTSQSRPALGKPAGRKPCDGPHATATPDRRHVAAFLPRTHLEDKPRSDEGAALVPKIPPVFGQTATRLSGGIDQDELQIAHRVLVRMQENLSATD